MSALVAARSAAWFPEKGGIQLYLHTWNVSPVTIPAPSSTHRTFGHPGCLFLSSRRPEVPKGWFSAAAHRSLVINHYKIVSKDAVVLLGTNLPWICLPSHFGACLSALFPGLQLPPALRSSQDQVPLLGSRWHSVACGGPRESPRGAVSRTSPFSHCTLLLHLYLSQIYIIHSIKAL